MASGDGPFFLGILSVAILGGSVGIAIGANIEPSDAAKAETICEYKGGTYKTDVCIKDGKVIIINLE